MRWLRRLAVLVSAFWVAVVLVACLLDPDFKWAFFVVIGVAPIALLWGVAWVVDGFRYRE